MLTKFPTRSATLALALIAFSPGQAPADDRAADRAAIRAHTESSFRA